MKSTPAPDMYNPDLLAMMPQGCRRVVDVGCSTGLLAGAYRKENPASEFIGIELDRDYAEAARQTCTHVICGDIEIMVDAQFATLFPSDCWVFGDSLEHLRDPWALLRRIRARLGPDGHVVACIPNAQHWSVQARLLTGAFRYEEAGLLDRTHLRWFTRTTTRELFERTGYSIVDARPRILPEPGRDKFLAGIHAMAAAIGADPGIATDEATVFQWLVRATPAERPPQP